MAAAPKGTPWKPGQSGNPKGRPPGSGAVGKVREAIAAHVPAIIARLSEQALAGDVQAARLLLERTVAPLKPVEVPVVVQAPGGASLSAHGRQIIEAAGRAELAPGQAAALLSALAGLAKLVETDELAARVAARESAAKAEP